MKRLFLTLLVVIAMMTGCSSMSNDKTNEAQDTPEVQEVQMSQEVEVPTDAVNEQDTKHDELTDAEQSEPEQSEPEENISDYSVTGADNGTTNTQSNAGTSTGNENTSNISSQTNNSSNSNTETNQGQTNDTASSGADVQAPSGILPGEIHPDGHREGTLSTDESVKDWIESSSNGGAAHLHDGMAEMKQDLIDQGLISGKGMNPEALQKLREEGFTAVGKND